MKKLRMTMMGDYERCPFLCKVNWGTIGEIGKADTEVRDMNKYAWFGIVFHEVMEIHALAKMEGNLIPLETLHNILDEKLANTEMSMLKDIEELDEWKESLHNQLDWGFEEATLEHTNVIGAEATFELDNLIPECLPFTGTMDRIVGNLDTKEVAIEDWKTGRVYTKKELSSNIQATVYSLAFYKMFGFMPEEFRFYFTKHKKVKVIKITPDFIKKGTERILENWYKMNNNEWNPNTANKYFCKNFCSISKECITQKKVEKKGWEKIK